MDKEQFLNILRSLNSYLDELRDSLTTVERNHPKQLSYLTQLHKSIKVNNCYKICYSVPTLGDCGSSGDGGGGACAWIKSSDFNGVIDSWENMESYNVMATIYMDSLDQFNSTIDQIQSVRKDYFAAEADHILSIDFSTWLDAIKAEAKEQFNNRVGEFQVVVTEDYSIEDMSAPQSIMNVLNVLLPYMDESVYYARVVAYIYIYPTVEDQYIVGFFPMIEFTNHDGMQVMFSNVAEIHQVCFKGSNVAAFKFEHDSDSPFPSILKQSDSVLSSFEGTKWLKSQGGFTTIDYLMPRSNT